ncbi:MAG TPA: NAD(P)-dependent alcohol dehydrogenase, partial [Pirellulales bacterium]
SRVQPGDVVLTQGTGGVSLFAIQFAHAAGARVISTSSSDDKLARLTELGASDLINYKKQPKWADEAMRLTNGLGVDRVIEVGGAGTLPLSMKAVKRGGVVSLIGVLTGQGEFNPTSVLMKSVRLQGIFVGSKAMFETMNRAIAQHQLRPVVDRTFGFDELQPALEYMQSGKHFGKICLKI